MKEYALIRAMRKNCFDIVDLILELNKATVLTYDVCLLQDSSNRNVLHHAVLKEQGEFIKKFVQLDGDQSKMRD